MAAVNAKIVRLCPPPVRIAHDAAEAFSRADYDRVLELTDGMTDLGCALLRLRVLRRLGDVRGAAAGLAAIDPGELDAAPPAEAAIFCALGGHTLALAHDEPGARMWATFARVYATQVNEPEPLGELACIFADPAPGNGPFGHGDPAPAFAAGIDRIVALAHEVTSARAGLAGEATGMLAGAQAALLANDRSANPDRWFGTEVLTRLATFAAYRDDRPMLAFAVEHYERGVRPHERGPRRAQIACRLAAGAAAQNNMVAAFRYLRDAADDSRAGIPERVEALTFRSRLASFSGERQAAHEAIAAAERSALGSAFDWTAAPPERRLALLALAAERSRYEVAAGLRALAAYDRLPRIALLDSGLTSCFEARIAALEALGRGRIDLARGRRDRALTYLSYAFELFRRHDAPGLAGECAVALHRLGIATTDVVDALDLLSERFPHSWLTRLAAG